MKTITVDVAIIGAGTAGMTSYRAAKRAGKRVVLIESGPYGTTCARVGCMPSKLLIAAADAAHTAQTAGPLGVHAENVRIDGASVMKRVREERDRFVDFALDDIRSFDDSDNLVGHARFVSDTQLQVGDHTCVNATSSVIATGSSPLIAGDFSHLGDRVIVNDDVFDWTSLPDRVLVVGAGALGLELGQALSRLGVQTTIINLSDGVGGLRDPSVRASAVKIFAAELDLRFHTVIKRAERVGNSVHVELGSAEKPATGHPQSSSRNGTQNDQTLVVDYILMAVGRKPNLNDLGLENTSVVMDERDQPVVDSKTLQLTPAPIFIAGDATGTLSVLHEAADEGYITGSNAAAYPELTDEKRRAPMGIVFSDPQLAHVGKRYSDLIDTDFVAGEVDFFNQGRSRIIQKNYGKLRVYLQKGTGLFLGAEMAGPQMEHIAHLLSWSVQQKLNVHDMLAMPYYHPVIEEGLRTALRDAARQLS